MDSAKWKTIKQTFSTVLELPITERTPFLTDFDEEIRNEVGKLLSAHEKAENFIEQPFFIEQGLAENEFEENLSGKQINNYLILEKIGEGGMGVVYLAEHCGKGFSQKVALKIIKRGMDTNAVLRRFIRERQILSRLEHPNIARLLDGGTTDDGLPFFVMEYVEGLPVTKFCDEHQFDTKERLELFRQICAAVAYSHQNLIIHRDLKPSNILITKDGTPKLLDFGIAKLLNLEGFENTATQGRIFTPEYASPEQLNGLPITTASDVYSLGVILYELLSGQRPFISTGKSYREVANLVLTQEPVRPSSVISQQSSVINDTSKNNRQRTKEEGQKTNPKSKIQNLKSLKGDLDNIILKSLRKESERRYQSVPEFSEDIRRFLVGLPVTATADSTFYRFSKFVGRNKIGTAVACLILLLSGFSIWQGIVANRERAKAEQRFNDVRQLANSVVFEFHDSIEKLPGSTATRELMLRRALEYLDKLASDSKQDFSLQMELADSYEKIGDIQGGLSTNHLGNRAKAEESYDKALAIRENLVAASPQNTDYQIKLASSYTKISNMFWVKVIPEDSLKMCRKALEIYQKLAQENPESIEIKHDFAKIYTRFGYLLGANNKTEESLEASKKAIVLLEELVAIQSENSDFQYSLVAAYDDYAMVIDRLKQDYAESLIYYQKSLTISQKLVTSKPDNLGFRRGLAVCYFNLADILEKMGEYKTGLENAQKSLEIFSKMLAEDPQNEEFKQIFAAVDTQVSLLLIKTGKSGEAIKKLKSSLEVFKKLLEASPNDEIVHYRIAITHEVLGRGYSALASDKRNNQPLENWNIAREHFQKSYQIYKSFRDKGKTVGTDASVVDDVAEEIAKCEAAISKIQGR